MFDLVLNMSPCGWSRRLRVGQLPPAYIRYAHKTADLVRLAATEEEEEEEEEEREGGGRRGERRKRKMTFAEVQPVIDHPDLETTHFEQARRWLLPVLADRDLLGAIELEQQF